MCDHLKIFESENPKECQHTMHPGTPKCIVCPECEDTIPWKFQKDILLRILKNNYHKIFKKGEEK